MASLALRKSTKNALEWPIKAVYALRLPCPLHFAQLKFDLVSLPHIRPQRWTWGTPEFVDLALSAFRWKSTDPGTAKHQTPVAI